tara:strand:+ start:579 stop:857 length:279 start_codon:yes stop_codon:yes gene_type:complete
MSTLTLPLKSEYFDQIKSGEKVREFRLQTAYWAKRLEGREYDQIVLTKGYPKRDDQERRITRPWNGFEKQTITHPHFGTEPVQVYAINVNVI